LQARDSAVPVNSATTSIARPDKGGGKKAAKSLRPALKSAGFTTILVEAGFVSDSGGFSGTGRGDCGTA
jgi:hypothetical protein